jgi:ketosteroid isomerase-like protein
MDPKALWTDYERGGAAAILPHLAPDVVWEEASPAPGSETWHGREGVIALNERWLEEFDGFRFERRGGFVTIGDATVAVPVSARGRGRASGIEVDWTMVMVCHYRDGLIDHTFFCETLDEVRERAAELGWR